MPGKGQKRGVLVNLEICPGTSYCKQAIPVIHAPEKNKKFFCSAMVLDHQGNEIEIEAFHPGEFLQEEIEARNTLKKDVAKSLDILPHHLSEIFAGKRNISARLPVKSENYSASVPIIG
ncbi:hypothetical protein [Mucilaginibacter sp.]|uniref:helix-turn-helix transcriptional regulator n=1 Tax=Mucilaginibacter sp. TaxID=1882438 RepID=UPI0028483125|nr:hypothetical protein [Mucilaginibacter sp.]MDR3697743.1 hypothetical protein [Mucilaginibacter sp.]